MKTHIRLVLDKLQASTIHDENVLQLGRTLLCIDLGRIDDVGGVLSLLYVRDCTHGHRSYHLQSVDSRLTLQFLQRHTKLASPRLPLCSLCSCDLKLINELLW
jgi:hypothetical protein